MSIGDVLRVSDLPHCDKLKFLTDEDTTVAHVVSIKEEVAATPDAVAAAAALRLSRKSSRRARRKTAAEAPAEKGAKK